MTVFDILADEGFRALLVAGTRVTVYMAVLSYLLAFVVGNAIAACRVSPVPLLQRFGAVYTSIFRNTPLLVLAILVWVGGGRAGWPFGRITTGIIVLGLYTGAYIAEALRSGINSVPPGQAEAARAIGLSFSQTLRLIVLPQAFRSVIGPLANVLIALTKNTTVAAAIGVAEAAALMKTMIENEAQTLLIGAVFALGFVVLTLPTGLILGWLGKRLAVKR